MNQSQNEKFYEQTKQNQFLINSWTDCPSYANSESILKEKIFETIAVSRAAALMRLTTLFQQELLMQTQRKSFLSPESLVISPLYVSVPATLIQVVTHLFQRFYTTPEIVSKEIVTFFSSQSTEYADLFSTVTFPAIFFYFMTNEFSDAGCTFIEHCLNFQHNNFTASLLASFLDCFPRFTETLWATFEKNCNEKSVFLSFVVAIKHSFRQLTPHHSYLIRRLYETDPQFLSDFFFRQYFQPRAHMKYYTACGDKFLGLLLDLVRILKYAASNYGLPHQQILMNAILESQSESLSSQELSYVHDIQLPVIFSLLSGTEIAFLREFLLQSDIIKFKPTLRDNDVSECKKKSLDAGFVQFSAKPISAHSNRPPLSTIFSITKLQHIKDELERQKSNKKSRLTESLENDSQSNSANNENQMNSANHENEGNGLFGLNDFPNEEETNFERLWKKIGLCAQKYGLTVPTLINTGHLLNHEISTIVNSTLVKSDQFRSFMLLKLNEKKIDSEQSFEIFIGRLQTERQLSRICEDFRRDSQMCMWKNAQEFVLKNCIAQGNTSSTIINDDSNFITNSFKFMKFRYNENVSCQHFYLHHLHQQRMQQKTSEKTSSTFSLSSSSNFYSVDDLADFNDGIQLNQISEPQSQLKLSESKSPLLPATMKMKKEKFEDLLKIVKIEDNIAEYNYHYVLALLNEWPSNSEGMPEIKKLFSSFSDKRRCLLAENKSIVSAISNNEFVMTVFKRMQNLVNLKLGNQIAELVHIIM